MARIALAGFAITLIGSSCVMERARGIEPPRSNFGKPECESCGRTKNIEGERNCRNFEYVAVPRNQSEIHKAGTQDSGLFFCVSYTLFSDSTGRNQDGKLARGGASRRANCHLGGAVSSVCSQCVGAWNRCSLFTPQFLPHMDLRSSAFKGNFVHGQFHQVDAAPVFGTEVFERQRIGNFIGVESLPLIPDYDRQSTAAFAAATDVDQLACVSAIAVEHRITQGFPKREFNELFLSANTARCYDQSYKLIHQRRDLADLALHPGVHLQRCIREAKFGEHRLQRFETANPNHLCNTFQELFFGA